MATAGATVAASRSFIAIINPVPASAIITTAATAAGTFNCARRIAAPAPREMVTAVCDKDEVAAAPALVFATAALAAAAAVVTCKGAVDTACASIMAPSASDDSCV